MSVLHINNITNKEGTGGPTIAGITTVDSTGFMRVPVGSTGRRLVSDFVPNSIIDDGLVLYLDAGNIQSYSGSGTTWRDLSGNGNNGTLVNGVGFSAEDGGSLEFDGVDDYVTVSSLPAFGDNDPITIESWVNADTTTNVYQVISTAKATTTHWQLSFTGSAYNILWAFAGTSNSVGTTTLPSVGVWHHIVATYNGGDKTQLASWKVYVDGSSSNIQLTGSTGAVSNETIIGFRTGGSSANRFDGNIAQVSIYNRALTAQEVLQNFNATRSRYGI